MGPVALVQATGLCRRDGDVVVDEPFLGRVALFGGAAAANLVHVRQRLPHDGAAVDCQEKVWDFEGRFLSRAYSYTGSAVSKCFEIPAD